MKSPSISLIVLALAACASGNDDEAPPFNRWCGAVPCDWTLEEGRIERAPTWHEKDYGARMLDAPVVISRATTMDHERCTRFSLVGDIDAEAQLALELDVYDEGPIEFEETIPETHWQKQTFVVPPVDLEFSDPFAIVPASLRLHKRGAGNVVLARLEVEPFSCVATSLIAISEIPVGEFCSNADQCRSRRCEPSPSSNPGLATPIGSVCFGCTSDADCAEGGSCVSRSHGLGGALELDYYYRECAALSSGAVTDEPAR